MRPAGKGSVSLLPARGDADALRTSGCSVDALAKGERARRWLEERQAISLAYALDMENWAALQQEAREPQVRAFLERS